MEEKRQNLKRENWIDYAKFIGIFLVVLGHTINHILETGLMIWIYSFHMPLFFIIAGYLVKENDTIYETIKKGFKGLIIPYIAFYLITLVFLYTLQYLFDPNFLNASMADRLMKAGLGLLIGEGGYTDISVSHNHPLWFLVALFFCKVFVQFAFLQKKSTWGSLFVIILLSVISVYILTDRKINIYWSIDSAVMGIPFYIFGYFFKKHDFSRNFSPYIVALVGAVSLLVGYVLSTINGGGLFKVDMNSLSYGYNLTVFYINGIIGSLAIIFTAKLFSNSYNKFCLYIGENTLIVLGFHSIAILVIKYLIVEKIIRRSYPFNINYLCLEDIIITILILILLLIPIYIIRNYFPSIIGKSNK